MSGLSLVPQIDREGGVELRIGWDYAPLPFGLIQWTAQFGLRNIPKQ